VRRVVTPCREELSSRDPEIPFARPSVSQTSSLDVIISNGIGVQPGGRPAEKLSQLGGSE